MIVPPEVLDQILLELPVKQTFALSVHFRRIFVRDCAIRRYEVLSPYSACETGKTGLFAWWMSHGKLDNCVVTFCLDTAAQYGHVAILELYKSTFSRQGHLPVTDYAFDCAASNNQVYVLTWLHRHFGSALRYSHLAAVWASQNGNINVLDWLYDNLAEYPWCLTGLQVAMRNRLPAIEDWYRVRFDVEVGSLVSKLRRRPAE